MSHKQTKIQRILEHKAEQSRIAKENKKYAQETRMITQTQTPRIVEKTPEPVTAQPKVLSKLQQKYEENAKKMAMRDPFAMDETGTDKTDDFM
jgi:hypothetical protein